MQISHSHNLKFENYWSAVLFNWLQIQALKDVVIEYRDVLYATLNCDLF